ncbi:MAG TPA: sigma-70 family RNA polymerase sigma factor [Bacteroidota bacterium]|nr:sigma-70 family RNA polymerase sigma factor [Bacteroidota bacterium]
MKKERLTPDSDLHLIDLARRGNKRAFAQLVRRYEDMVYKFSYKVCRDRQKAEEALQDTFINMYRNLGSFDGRSKLSTWLYRIVTNNCLMKRRRRKLEQVLESYDNPPMDAAGTPTHNIPRWEETPADVVMKRELREVLEKAIQKLPVDYRIVFILRDVEGNSNEETAKILGLSVEATKSRLRRARAFLRDQLNPYLAAEEKPS